MGAPSYGAHLRQQINDLGLNHQVEMMGEVLAEALAHAVPVIASKGTRWSELRGNFFRVRGPIIKIEIENRHCKSLMGVAPRLCCG